MAHFDYETPGWMCGLERRKVLRDRADLEDHLSRRGGHGCTARSTSAANKLGEVRERAMLMASAQRLGLTKSG